MNKYMNSNKMFMPIQEGMSVFDKRVERYKTQ